MIEVYKVKLPNGQIGLILLSEGEWLKGPIEDLILSDNLISCYKCSNLAASFSVLRGFLNNGNDENK